MSLRTKAATGLKWQAIEIIGRQSVSFVVFAAIARLLDPSAFGLVGLVAVYLTFVGIFVDQGIGTALIQRKELEQEHINAAFWFNMGCAVIFCFSTIALAGPVAQFFGQPQLVSLLRWGSLALVMNASSAVHSALFLRTMDFRRPMIRALVADIAGGAVGVAMAVAGCGVWALIGQQLTASAAGACFLWAASTWRPSRRFSIIHLKELLAVSSSVFMTSFLWFFASRVDQIVIGRFNGSLVLGEYVVGSKLSDLAYRVIQQPIGVVSMPALSRVQGDHARMCSAIYKGMELNALVSFAVFGGLAAVAPSLVPLVFGEKWTIAGTILQLLCIYNLMLGMLVYCYPALLASGGLGRYVLLNVSCALGAGVVCLAGIRYGVHWLVIGLILNMMVTGFVSLLFLRRRIGLSPWEYCRPCVVPAFAATVMFGAVQLFSYYCAAKLQMWQSTAIEIFVGASVYLIIVYTTAPHSLTKLWEVAVHAIGIRSEPT